MQLADGAKFTRNMLHNLSGTLNEERSSINCILLYTQWTTLLCRARQVRVSQGLGLMELRETRTDH